MKLSYAILYVENIERSVKFYENALGLQHKFTHEGGDYAEMNTGETTLAFCSFSLAENILDSSVEKSSLNKMPQSTQITFSPENVKAAYLQAIKNGASSISKPVIKPWNFEVAMIRDLDGHIIELAKNLNIKMQD